MRHYYTIVDYDAADETYTLKNEDETIHSYLWELDTELGHNKLVGKRISLSYLKPLVYDAVGVKLED